MNHVECKVCGLWRSATGHGQTLEECNRLLARENRTCGHPRDHHRFQPDWGVWLKRIWGELAEGLGWRE